MLSSDLPKLWTETTKILSIKVGLLIKYSSQKKSLERFDQFSTLKNDFECTNFAIFDKVVHNFGKSDDALI